MFQKSPLAGMACAILTAVTWARSAPDPPPQTAASASAPDARPAAHPPKPGLDLSGRKRTGKASVYGGEFSGRRMADGTRMDPQEDSAASKTLPLGTTAKVTNLATGASAVVTIRDRGPYVKGRIVDLSPAAADKVGIDRHDGVAKVEVAPIDVPKGTGRATPLAASPDSNASAHRARSPAASGAR